MKCPICDRTHYRLDIGPISIGELFECHYGIYWGNHGFFGRYTSRGVTKTFLVRYAGGKNISILWGLIDISWD